MKVCVLLFLTAVSASGACRTDEVMASDPVTGGSRCVGREVITVVSESDCAPCRRQMQELRAALAETTAKPKLRILWTDRERAACTASALRFASLGENLCLTQSEAKRWDITGTPTQFWREGGAPRRSQGAESAKIWRARFSSAE